MTGLNWGASLWAPLIVPAILVLINDRSRRGAKGADLMDANWVPES